MPGLWSQASIRRTIFLLPAFTLTGFDASAHASEETIGAARVVPRGIIQSVLGDIPMIGFYANGEVAGDRIYGYTGVLALF